MSFFSTVGNTNKIPFTSILLGCKSQREKPTQIKPNVSAWLDLEVK